MHRLIDRDAVERETIAAHSLYIAALARAERVRYEIQRTNSGIAELDLMMARSELDKRFLALRELLDSLGYIPCGLTASLPPEPGADI